MAACTHLMLRWHFFPGVLLESLLAEREGSNVLLLHGVRWASCPPVSTPGWTQSLCVPQGSLLVNITSDMGYHCLLSFLFNKIPIVFLILLHVQSYYPPILVVLFLVFHYVCLYYLLYCFILIMSSGTLLRRPQF